VTDGVEVHVSQRVVSSVPGRAGNWSYSTDMRLPIVPRVGDWLICPLPAAEAGDAGEHTESVKDVFLGPGRVHVELRPVKTDSGQILDELAERGWEQHAGPWANQGGTGTEAGRAHSSR
jgi:hypothetical protein